ncbi:sensor histidine kinase [Mesorhizobium xinjiangense]|uniref:sensor histidine kinase n=1 Tax=Mesorhizobium xinjiangense TaxID=2678685 RepID=UPI0012EDDE22|nr:sensor histidine kinase [Mesorhizobium xinjiangense]
MPRIRHFLSRLLRQPRTLRAHLIAFAVALVLPLALLAALAAVWITRTELAANEARLQAMATSASATIDREINAWITVLETLATSEMLETRDFAAFHMRARAALRNRPAHVVLLDQNFDQLLDTRVPYGTPLPQTADTESAENAARTGRPYVSDAFAGSDSDARVINILLPVTRDDAQYLMLIALTTERIGEIIGNEKPPEGWTIAVSDRKAQLLASNPAGGNTLDLALQPLRPDRVSGVIEPDDDDGQNLIEAYRWSALTGWRTSVRVDRSVLDAPLWNGLVGVALFAAAAIALGLALASRLGRRIALSMRHLRVAAADLAAERAIDARQLPITEANAVTHAVRRAAGVISERSTALRASEEQSRAQLEQIRLLMREMVHRNKNIMSVIQAIARRISRRATTLDEFRRDFDDRIAALVSSNELLFGSGGSRVALTDLIRQQLAAFVEPGSQRLEMQGPAVALRPEAVQSIGLALHELATNATKYGALSDEDGRIRVTWARRGRRGIALEWKEIGGPPVAAPSRYGFGHVVIDRLTGQNLDGEVDYVFAATGVEWRLRAPDVLADEDDAPEDNGGNMPHTATVGG